MNEPLPHSSMQRVAVIGGGVIGAFCAWYLRQAGHEVTIIERAAFGSGCSHGNCGYVSPSHVLPLAQPGAVRDAIGSMLRPNSPLCVRLRWSPSFWKWLFKFSMRCNRRDMLLSGTGRQQLLQSSLSLYKQFVAEQNIECDWTEKGLLFVFASERRFDEYAKTDLLLTREFGVIATPLDGDQLIAKEPALKSGLGGAWYYPDDCHLRSDKLMSSLKKLLEKVNTQIVEHFDVSQFECDKHGCRAVVNPRGQRIEADAFVVATGALTPFLNQHLGCRLPIQPGKGYSLTMPQPKRMPNFPMILEEHRVAITPLTEKYRIGSTMEFAGYDATVNRKRMGLLLSAAEQYLHEPHCTPIEEEWFGWRPMTWDGNPIIDRSPKMNNVWIAAGHNMVGISMATGTGRLVRELIDAEPPHVDPSHYSLARFQ